MKIWETGDMVAHIGSMAMLATAPPLVWAEKVWTAGSLLYLTPQEIYCVQELRFHQDVSEQDDSNFHGLIASETSKLEQAKHRILEQCEFRNAFQQVHPSSPHESPTAQAIKTSQILHSEHGDDAPSSDPLRELLLHRQPQFITLPPDEHHAFFFRSRAS
ncbi:hypothetical protein BJ742DRAFT_20863 [Cladochytrium replicatum]|nr:hypothetical protein BJ742DRAFT_20863 [Cladochytrium replicatum]